MRTKALEAFAHMMARETGDQSHLTEDEAILAELAWRFFRSDDWAYVYGECRDYLPHDHPATEPF